MAKTKRNLDFSPIGSSKELKDEQMENMERIKAEQEAEMAENPELMVREDPVEHETETFSVPKGAEKRYFVRISLKGNFDSNTGKKLDKPFVQSFDKYEYEALLKNAPALGYELETLYKPEN